MKKITVILLCLIVVLAACGTNDLAYEEESFPISPVAEAGSGETVSVTLYFGYQEEDMLGTETRLIEMPLDERPETFIIRQLIGGPSASYAELRGLFNNNVEIVSVESSGRMLILTLSRAFLDMPLELENDPDQAARIRNRNRLALYSIANTVTELGEYDRVQLQVAGQNNASAQRIKKSDVALNASAQDESLLGAIGREYNYILSPRRTVEIALDAWSKNDFAKLYNYLAADSGLPIRDVVTTTLSNADIALIRHQVLDTTVSSDGQSATVSLDMEYMESGSGTDIQQNTIIKLVRENETWKILYSSIELMSNLPG